MRKISQLIIGTITLMSLAYAGEKNAWSWQPVQLKGSYSIYSGELGEEQAPTRLDRKLAFEITGQPAKEIFDSMYPDFKPTCSGEKRDRDRRKGNLYCTFTANRGYRCFLGFNLRTGASIPGASC